MNSGCPLFSLPVYGRYQLAFLANRSLLLASPPSIPAVLFCAYANKKSPCILRTFLFGTPGGNRTHNGPLGGGCYIHLTTEAYFILNVFPPTPGGYLPKPLKGSPRQSVASLARTHNGPEGARAVLSIEPRKRIVLNESPPHSGSIQVDI